MAQQNQQLSVQPRTVFGNQAQKLRRDGIIPANIYGAQIESVAIQMPVKAAHSLLKVAGESEIVYVQVEGEKDARPVLIGSSQTDPVSRELVHVDFRQVNMSEEVTVEVEIVFVGDSVAEKRDDLVILELMDHLEVTALPANLPSDIQVDISGLLEVGDHITVGDLQLGGGIKIEAEPDQLIVKLDMVNVEAEEAAMAEAAEAVEEEEEAEEVSSEEPVAEEETGEEEE